MAMKKTLSLTVVILAIAAVVTGMTTIRTAQIVQAATPAGNPYADLVSSEAKPGGFGQDIKGLCEKGTCGGTQ
jgi:hypothetical protein